MLYDMILEDDIEGDFFFDALDNVDSSLDTYGDYTFLVKDPSASFSFIAETNSNNDGELIYCHFSAANV